MYDDEEIKFVDEKVWNHDWMTIFMIISITPLNLALTLKSQPRWMKLYMGSSISLPRFSIVRV